MDPQMGSIPDRPMGHISPSSVNQVSKRSLRIAKEVLEKDKKMNE